MEKKETDGTYTLLHRITSGARSVLWLAREEERGELCIVKEVPPEELPTPQDYEALLSLRAPALPVFYKPFKGRYPVMEYIRGRTFSQVLEEGPLPEMQVLRVLLSLSEALTLLHSRKPPLIHGDLKPGNVMLTDSGEVRLIDLDGCGRENRTTRFGTMGYAPPEQLSGNVLPASDQYSLAMLGTELLTGIPPHLRRSREGKLPCSRSLQKVLRKCLSQRAEDRFPDMETLHRELLRVKKRRSLLGRGRLLGAGLLLGGSLLGIMLWNAWKKELHYRELLTQAELTGDYEGAILEKPGRREGYEALLDELLRDQRVTEEEQLRLRCLHAGPEREGELCQVLRSFRKRSPRAFREFCRRAGEACLFFLSEEREADRLEAAMLWYREIPKDPEAGLMLELYETRKQMEYLEASVGGAKLDEACERFWEELLELRDFAGGQTPERTGWFYRELLELLDRQLGRLVISPGRERLLSFLEELLQDFSETSFGEAGYGQAEREELLRMLSALLERMGE